MNTSTDLPPPAALSADHREDIKLAASRMVPIKRRTFQASMAVKYCAGSPRQAEAIFGWSRQAVALGLHEFRTGIVCLGAQSVVAGAPLWEEKHPQAAAILWEVAPAYSQQDPTFRSTDTSTRLTAAEALKQLRARRRGSAPALAEHHGPGTQSERMAPLDYDPP